MRHSGSLPPTDARRNDDGRIHDTGREGMVWTAVDFLLHVLPSASPEVLVDMLLATSVARTVESPPACQRRLTIMRLHVQ